MGWSDGIAEGIKDLKNLVVGVLIVVIFFKYIVPALHALNKLSSDTSSLDYVVSVVSQSFALLGMIGIIGLLVALVKAISDWEYGIARAFVIIVGLPMVVFIIAVISPSMMSKAMGLALLALILLIGAMLGIALWILKSLDVLS